MVTLKVRRFGDALGVVLPEEVVARLKTRDGAPLYLAETADGGYQLIPHDPEFEAKMEAAEDIVRRYPDTLRALSR